MKYLCAPPVHSVSVHIDQVAAKLLTFSNQSPLITQSIDLEFWHPYLKFATFQRPISLGLRRCLPHLVMDQASSLAVVAKSKGLK